MIDVGRIYTLEIVKIVKIGAFLQKGDKEILLPLKYLPKDAKEGQSIEVFLYTDSEDRLIATTLKPYAMLGEIALLKVVDKNNFGCFLDLGIAKDLFMPTLKPQNYPLKSNVAVLVSVDREGRLIAKNDIKPYLKDLKKSNLKTFSEVEIIPFRATELGYECVINGEFLGLVYKNEVFNKNFLNQKYKAYIKKIYPNGKCDLSLKPPMQKSNEKEEAKRVLEILEQKGGKMEFNYDSTPQSILENFSMSKKAFKRALSELVKNKQIILENGNITKKI
ncbi:S1 RNA-binding domain-containing protein [Helicobacter burdigaliensis]|uniref:CvfB family protein n=1 Tax=Helicobacter burdigaliensis TaxID=2315334 RepID=UPI001E318675|nr:S1-like domain-containing RNA-binding protein [Helicobacter burdigaliensis]